MFYVNVEGAVFKEDKWLIIGRSMKDAPIWLKESIQEAAALLGGESSDQ
jgi:hypothetical protein